MVKKFVKLYLHSSYTVQISFCFDENPGKNISDEVLNECNINRCYFGAKIQIFERHHFFITKMKMIHF